MTFLWFVSPGFFGGNLPDYQRAEVMMFIMGKVPVFGTPCHTLDTVKIGSVQDLGHGGPDRK